MNWKMWWQGLIFGMVVAACTVLIQVFSAAAPPSGWWEIGKLAVPTILGVALAFMKQNPLPIPTVKSITIILLILMFSVSCAGPWQKKYTAAYELAGVAPTIVCNKTQEICKTPNQITIKPEQCVQLKKTCNDARAVYVLTGDALDSAVETDDAIAKNEFLKRYSELSAQYSGLVGGIIQVGINLKLIK